MLEKNRVCFLLLPGFASDHSSLLELEKKIGGLGYHAVAVNFWGVAEVPDISQLTIKDCLDGIARITAELASTFDFVIGVGMSLGGAFLIEHAKYGNGLDYIVSVGTPFKLKNRTLIHIGLNFPFMHQIWNAIVQPLSGGTLPPLATSRMIIQYFETDFLKNLDKVVAPILLIHSKRDKVTDYAVVGEYMAQLKSPTKNLISVDNANHVLNYNFDILLRHIFEVITV